MKEKILSFNLLSWIKVNKWQLFILVVLCLVTYANSLPNEFVSDDTRAFLESRRYYEFNGVLSQPLQFVQPLEYFVMLQIFGPNPAVFRLVTIAYHIGTVLLLYLLAWLLSKKSTAFIAASLFAVHPVLVESVVWISGGIHVKYAFFLVGSLLFFIFSSYRRKKIYWFWSVFLAFLAMAASEKAMVIPVILFLFQVIYRLRIPLSRYLPYAVLIVIYAFVVFGGYGVRTSAYEFRHVKERELDNPFIQVPVSLTSYLELIFFPKDLTLYHSEMVFYRVEFIIRVAVTLGYFLTAFATAFFVPAVSFFMLFFVVTLLPTLTPLGISWYVAERYVYIGTFGVLAAAAHGLAWIYGKMKAKYLAYIGFFLLILALGVRTMVRNADWKNGDRLYLAAAKTSPSSPQNRNNLGDYYARQGQYERSIAEFEAAIGLQPGYADAYHNMASTYFLMKKYDEAIANYRKAYELNPMLWQSHTQAAVIFFELKAYSSAAAELEQAIKINPQDQKLLEALTTVKNIMSGSSQP